MPCAAWNAHAEAAAERNTGSKRLASASRIPGVRGPERRAHMARNLSLLTRAGGLRAWHIADRDDRCRTPSCLALLAFARGKRAGRRLHFSQKSPWIRWDLIAISGYCVSSASCRCELKGCLATKRTRSRTSGSAFLPACRPGLPRSRGATKPNANQFPCWQSCMELLGDFSHITAVDVKVLSKFCY